MGRHMLFSSTSWTRITTRQVESYVFKPVQWDVIKCESPYFLCEPLLEGVKSAKYIKKCIDPQLISFDESIYSNEKQIQLIIRETNRGEKRAWCSAGGHNSGGLIEQLWSALLLSDESRARTAVQ